MIRSRTIRWYRLGDLGLASLWGVFAMLRFVEASERVHHGHLLEGTYLALLGSVLAFEAAFFMVRGPALARHRGLVPQLAVVIATGSILPLSMLDLQWTSGWLLATMTLCLIGLHCFIAWALLALNRSFSISPEARKLVQHGPYALVRHPLYAAYMPMFVCIGLPRLSIEAAALVVAGIAALIVRARSEEAILRSVFPEYAAYAAVTPRFVPRPAALHRMRRQRRTGQVDAPAASASDPIPGHI